MKKRDYIKDNGDGQQIAVIPLPDAEADAGAAPGEHRHWRVIWPGNGQRFTDEEILRITVGDP